MAPGFTGSLQLDLEDVNGKINKAFKLRTGHLSKFAHLEYTPLEMELRPALVILVSRLFGNSGEQVNYLAAIVQFIFMAATVHFEIPDTDLDLQTNPGMDPRDGSQIPVLVGDYLFGKFFSSLCDAGLHDYLDPLARIIAEINVGGMKRKQINDLRQNDQQNLKIVEMETASLFACACRLSAQLAGADAPDIERAASFGLNLGMAYGLTERDGISEAGTYLDKAREILELLPAKPEKKVLSEIIGELDANPAIVPGRRLGEEINSSLKTPKEKMVRNFFNSIAGKYDLMNTLASFGRHHYWRKFTVSKTNLTEGGNALDVCCGTGMVTMDLARKCGPDGKVTGLDFSENMLAVAREYLKDFPLKDIIRLVQGNAMELPFADNTFDCATIAYGLRNVPDMKKALVELYRVIKPGGRLVSLEFAKPYVPVFKQIYNFYVDKGIPLMGKISAKNKEAYKYLHDSIMAYPHQDEVTRIYGDIGFVNTECHELSWGIVAVHVGIKP